MSQPGGVSGISFGLLSSLCGHESHLNLMASSENEFSASESKGTSLLAAVAVPQPAPGSVSAQSWGRWFSPVGRTWQVRMRGIRGTERREAQVDLLVGKALEAGGGGLMGRVRGAGGFSPVCGRLSSVREQPLTPPS